MKQINFIKKKYKNYLQKILKQKKKFLFWSIKKSNSKNLIKSLNLLNFKTIWLKKNLFSSLSLVESNKKLIPLLKNQCFFSYNTKNDISLSLIIDYIDKNKDNLICLGFIWNNEIFFTLNRFNLIKELLIKTNGDLNKAYLLLLQKFFIFFVLHKIMLFKTLYILNYKKNFIQI